MRGKIRPRQLRVKQAKGHRFIKRILLIIECRKLEPTFYISDDLELVIYETGYGRQSVPISIGSNLS